MYQEHRPLRMDVGHTVVHWLGIICPTLGGRVGPSPPTRLAHTSRGQRCACAGVTPSRSGSLTSPWMSQGPTRANNRQRRAAGRGVRQVPETAQQASVSQGARVRLQWAGEKLTVGVSRCDVGVHRWRCLVSRSVI